MYLLAIFSHKKIVKLCVDKGECNLAQFSNITISVNP